ncbi:MAG: 30S ribosomal protein S12 methylthiotransferase RimO [Armatimonadetes bacterium]|nr:30S ribosomal protein S12 methylthiotransferase RimO [Armatimonadota bacterium]MDW8027969.1 30S ribosomal protein S12 methylthiotransferase RimO [Armatimonadota bacterium]
MKKSPIRCAVVSLGCPKNLVDSEETLGWLAQSDFAITTDLDLADVIIVNTCGFLKAAIEENLQQLKSLAKRKKQGKCKAIIAIGCLVSRFPELVKNAVPEVDACLGVGEYHKVPQLVAQLTGSNGRVQEILGEPPYKPRIVSTPRWYAYMKIAEGCDRTCTFCAIPFIRGKQKSRPMEDLLAEAKALAEQGVQEIILIAQDTTRYGVDLYGKPMLPELIRQIDQLDGLKWLRLLYCYPTAVSQRLIEAMAESEKVAHYIDIPLQHSHIDILRAMQRGGDDQTYARLIERLRSAIPDIAIRTTFIVGFPGETDKHFEHLLKFVKAMRFDRLGVFTFSPEEGTPAFQLANQVPKKVAEERRHLLLSTQREISLQRNKNFVGKSLEVVIERWDGSKGFYEARSQYEAPEIDGVVKVKAHSTDGLLGKFVNVKVTKALHYDLVAEFVVERGQRDDRKIEFRANDRI